MLRCCQLSPHTSKILPSSVPIQHGCRLGTATSQDASEPHSSCRMPQRAHVCGHMWGCQETFPSSPGALEPCPNSTRPVREPPGQVTTPCPRKGPLDLGGEGVAAAQKEGRLPELIYECALSLHAPWKSCSPTCSLFTSLL